LLLQVGPEALSKSQNIFNIRLSQAGGSSPSCLRNLVAKMLIRVAILLYRVEKRNNRIAKGDYVAKVFISKFI
jgi:hypothetical protein